MNRRLALLAVSVATTVAASALATSALAASSHSTTSRASHTATEYFQLAGNGVRMTVVAHGAFTGGGRDVPRSNYDVLYLGGGTVRIVHPDKASHFTSHVNPKTCFATLTITGPYELRNGSGRLAGVTGHGKYTAHGQVILPRTKTGSCNERSQPKAETLVINANGPVTMP